MCFLPSSADVANHSLVESMVEQVIVLMKEREQGLENNLQTMFAGCIGAVRDLTGERARDADELGGVRVALSTLLDGVWRGEVRIKELIDEFKERAGENEGWI